MATGHQRQEPNPDSTLHDARILVPGKTCWTVAESSRATVLVDTEQYFAALHDALWKAKRSILILGWDIDSREPLIRDPEHEAVGWSLRRVLSQVIRRNRELHAHVLIWDFAVIYAMEREWLPFYRLGWRRQRRLHFRTDGNHPVGASQHQKVVVIDDALAFVGGIDLSKWRWDTRAHSPDEKRRLDPDHKSYVPFHDVMLMVEGEAARRLGDLARERWRRATAQKLSPPPKAQHDPWPERITAQFENVGVGIARTYPAHGEQPEVREVERLYAASVAAAKRWLYVENQYLTCMGLADAMARRLQEADGPEIVLVLPKQTGGWLERNTMDALRARFLEKLRAADAHGRLRVFYPDVPGLAPQHISVHSKLMVVDDSLLRLGSSNLSNRSMALDSECDVAIEAGDEEAIKKQIAFVRNDLLAEHLGTDAETVAAAIARDDSLIGAVDSLRSDDRRTLRQLEGTVSKEWMRQLPDAAVIDPDEPLEPDRLAQRFLSSDQREHAGRHGLGVAWFIGSMLLLAALWRWTPLGDVLSVDRIDGWMQQIADSRFTPLILLALYLVAGLIVFPLVILVAATAVIFGPWLGLGYALGGSIASALLTFWVGSWLGRDWLRRFAGSRIDRLDRWLADRGILTIVTVRIIPIAPFTVVNLVAGASRISFRDYALGTVLGMTPGIALMVLFLDRLEAAVANPSTGTFLIVAAVGVAAVAAFAGLRYLLRRRSGKSAASKAG